MLVKFVPKRRDSYGYRVISEFEWRGDRRAEQC